MRHVRIRLKSPLVIRWFFSYLLIVILSITAGSISTTYARRVSFQQANQIQKGLMTQVQLDIDGMVNAVYNIMYRLTFNKNIARITTESDPYSIYQASSDFQSYLYENSSISAVFLYDPIDKMIISSAGYLDAEYYYSLYYPDIMADFETFQTQLLAEGYRNEIYLETAQGTPFIAFTQKVIPRNSMREMQATIILNPAYLIDRMEYLRWDEAISIAIQYDNGRVLAKAGPMAELADRRTGNEANYNVHTDTIDGEDYGIFTTKSNSTSWDYVTYVPNKVMYQGADKIGLSMVITILLLSTVGMVLAYRFAVKNYKPLRETIDDMALQLETPLDTLQDSNEYQWLKTAMATYSDRFRANAEMLKDYNLYVKNHLLFRLLETPFSVDRDHRELRRIDWPFALPYFLVVNFYYTNAQAISISASIEQGKRAISLAILSSFDSLAREQYPIEMIDMSDRVSAILNLADRRNESIEQVRELVLRCQEALEEDMGITIRASLGTIHAGIAEIYLSSNEAKEAGDFISSQDEDSIVLYDEIKNLRLAYRYPIEQEQQIINHILGGQEDQAIAVAKRVFRQNDSFLTGDMYKCLTLDMLGTIIKAANQTDTPDIIHQINITEIVSHEQSQKQLLRAISTITQDVISKRSSSKKNALLVSSVKQFVEEHYSDAEMNVSGIGKHFYLTPAYLSSIFRDETGISLLDYINQVRIEASKQLLLKRMNVNDVALEVGYKASGSFIRSFKKVVGTTPGQWAASDESYGEMA